MPRTRIRELFEPRLRRVTILSTLLVGCCYALAFGMLQHIPRVVPGLPGVAELARKAQEQFVSFVHFYVDTGAILGRLLFVGLAIYVIARRRMLQVFLLLGLVIFPLVFLGPPIHDIDIIQIRRGVRVGAGERAVQLLGQLPAARVPAASARHRRQLWCQHRRSRDRTHGGAGHHAAVEPGARRTPTVKLATSMALVVVTFTLLALLLSTRLPEPAPELPED